MPKPFVYISSPYSQGIPANNVRFQCTIFDQLLGEGRVIPVAPLWSHFQHLLYPQAYETWLQYDLALIDRMDACLRLAATEPWLNYEQWISAGAEREVARFKELNRPVFYNLTTLYDWVRNGR